MKWKNKIVYKKIFVENFNNVKKIGLIIIEVVNKDKCLIDSLN